MGNRRQFFLDILKTFAGCFLFSLGFNLFLLPNHLNAGGISGLAMVLVSLTNLGTVGMVTALVNIPLFALAGLKVGKRFFVRSLLGMLFSSVLIDFLSVIPHPETESLVGALYGGVLCGAGLGLVFTGGGSTGGSDIIVRLWKMKYPNISIGVIGIVFDMVVAVLTGIAFRDPNRMLYSGVAIFVTGQVVDAVVYRFDYTKVALIISKHYDTIAKAVNDELGRGVTYLDGSGYYSGEETKVVLTAVKRHQLSELKNLVVNIDPDAFIIVQEAHQVLGDGFSRHSKYSL